MSTIDGDFKRKVEQAATIQLSAPFPKIPQAMRAAGFTDEDSRSAAKQMQVRRARDALRMSTPEVDAEARAVLVKRSYAIQTLAFDSLNRTELDCLLRWHGVVPGDRILTRRQETCGQQRTKNVGRV